MNRPRPASPTTSTDMKIVTFNLRCAWRGDGINSFIHRAGLIYEKIMAERPSVIAFQEVITASLEVLKRLLPEYEFFGGMRTEQYDGEGLYTALRKEDTTLLGGEVFWLSPTPYIAGSRFEEQSIFPRVGIYTRVLCKQTGEVLSIFNLHLDYLSTEAAKKGLACTVAYIREHRGYVDADKALILGDFNVTPDSPALSPLREEAWLYDATEGITTTFHAFGNRRDVKIDYIFLSEAMRGRVTAVAPWQDEHAGIYLSDHCPVCLSLT